MIYIYIVAHDPYKNPKVVFRINCIRIYTWSLTIYMSKLVHNITVTVFEKDKDKIKDHKKIFQYLLPIDFKKEKIDVSVEAAEGFGQKTIYILRLKTEKSRHNKKLLNTIFSKLNVKDKKRIGKQNLTRINQEGYFFIRLKKPEMLEKKLILTESGDCYHFKIKLAGFPAKWEQFVIAARSLLKKYDCFESKY